MEGIWAGQVHFLKMTWSPGPIDQGRGRREQAVRQSGGFRVIQGRRGEELYSEKPNGTERNEDVREASWHCHGLRLADSGEARVTDQAEVFEAGGCLY